MFIFRFLKSAPHSIFYILRKQNQMIFFILLLFQSQQNINIEELKTGKGDTASYGASLSVHYKGYLKSNGIEFDNSYKRGKPLKIVLGKSSLIQGWHLGLKGVQKGSIRRLTIPPKYGYGKRAYGNIPANSTLVFEIEVIDLIKADNGWELSKDFLEQKAEHVRFYDIKKGTGKKAKKGSKVTYHYKLYDKNKILLHSTRKFKRSESIVLGEKKHMIKGLENGLYGMQVGGKRKLFCDGPMGDKSDPFIFDLELIKVE